MSPRAVSGPTLLTGICFFASCVGAMTLRTGKGSAGDMHRYYTCSTKARQGQRGCRDLTVPIDKLDRAVVDHLESRLLDAARLTTMMDQLLERREKWNERGRGHIAELRKRTAEAEANWKRLHKAIENSVVDMADPSLKDRIAELTAVRDQAQPDVERATSAVERVRARDHIGQFATVRARRAAQAAERRWNLSAGPLARATCRGRRSERNPHAWHENQRSAWVAAVSRTDRRSAARLRAASREAQSHGHEVKIFRPRRWRSTVMAITDANDALAIVEAARRPKVKRLSCWCRIEAEAARQRRGIAAFSSGIRSDPLLLQPRRNPPNLLRASLSRQRRPRHQVLPIARPPAALLSFPSDAFTRYR